MKSTAEVVKVKDAFAWIEDQREIHLRATTKDGGAVVLTADDARRLAERIARLADVLDSLQTEPSA